jgi:ABC-type antimicrobial peptide transport system permease subunit
MDRVSAIEIRTSVDPAGVIAAARQEVSAIHPKLVVDARTVPAQIDDMLAQERMIGKLSGFFGALALILASGGLYGLMAYSVARRTGEIGIRMALGAQRDSVLWMILRETITVLLAGLAVGIPVALAAARLAGHWIEGLLFDLKATDPVTLLMASLMLGAAALLAGAIPARRASQLDPMQALRCE